MTDSQSRWIERDDLTLHAVDFGGLGPPVLLLHGLAGYAGEWAETAAWLREEHLVLAPDQRGHGASARFPPSVSPEAFVADVLAWIDSLHLGQVSLVGQSFGGLIALLTAASHADRIERLVVAEASPAADPQAEPSVRAWLASWPTPFADEGVAVRFFGGSPGRAQVWAGGLERREDGLWPRFDQATLLAALRESAAAQWDAWEAIRCPTLIVRGEGGLPATEAETMAARQNRATLKTVQDAGHDVHLDQPAAWRAAVLPFLTDRS